MKKMLIVGMILAIFMNGGTFTVLGAYHPVYGEVIFDDGFIKAATERSGDVKLNVDEKNLEGFSDRGDGVYVYGGNAGNKNVDVASKIVETYNSKGLDEPESGVLSPMPPISASQNPIITPELLPLPTEKERIAQELGTTRVQILEEVLKLLADKPKADQEKIYQIVKTFTESEDPYTQNIGKYMTLSIAPN